MPINTKVFEVTSRILARNAFFNFVGQASVAILAIALLPLTVRKLGNDSFGLLALALVFFSSFSLLELGLGRTTTKYVAEYLAKGEQNRLGVIVWTSLEIQTTIGVLLGVIIAAAAPFLANSVFKVSPSFTGEAEKTLLILALAAPITLASYSLRGALEGAQRFDIVNYVKVVLNSSTYLLPFLGALAHLKVSIIVLLILGTRILATGAYLWGCLYAMPQLRQNRPFFDIRITRMLLSYAGWVAATSLIVPLMVQADRYLIGTLISVKEVTYYSVPYELLNGFWIIPAAISMTIFPAFTTLSTLNSGNLSELFIRSVKYLIVLLFPIILVALVFSRDLLLIWQGSEFALRSNSTLQILLVGVSVNALAYIPSSFLHGIGRPDLVAKISLFELPIYLVVAYLSIRRHGIIGAAFAFTFRASIDGLLLFLTAARLIPSTRMALVNKRSMIGFALLMPFVFMLWTIRRAIPANYLVQAGFISIAYGIFLCLAWYLVFDNKDRRLFMARILRTNQEA